jgi:hypothetical protein
MRRFLVALVLEAIAISSSASCSGSSEATWWCRAGFIGSRGIHLVQDGRNIDQLDPQYLGLGPALNTNMANRGLRHFTSAPP